MVSIVLERLNTSLSRQTDITNNTIETNTQTTNYTDDNYLNDNNIATVILNPTPPLNENYLWTPGVSDNVVPGLDSMLTYIQSKYATLTALQNTITNINNEITNGINNVQTEINDIAISNVSNGSKYLHYNTTHTDYMYQENVINNHRTVIIQQHLFHISTNKQPRVRNSIIK